MNTLLIGCRIVLKRKKLSTTLIYKWKYDVNFGPFSFEMYPCPGHLKIHVIVSVQIDKTGRHTHVSVCVCWCAEYVLHTQIHSKSMTILV